MKKTAPILIVHLILVAAALAYGVLSASSLLFPSQVATTAEEPSLPAIPAVAETRRQLSPDTSGALGIWGLEEAPVDTMTDSSQDDGTTWNISLEEEGWLLTRKGGDGERWEFCGVIRRQTGDAAVFYNLDGDTGWRIVPENRFFDSLQLTSVDHASITLREAEKKEWRLGLYHLRRVQKHD